jgi:hypothetical protein
MSAECPQDPSAAEPAREKTWPEIERRVNPDRRKRPTTFLDTLVGPKRRRRGRRKTDREGLYVDVYHPRDVILVLAVFALNLADALFTLDATRQGGEQHNPFTGAVLQLGEHSFLWEKCFLMGFWLLLLIIHKNFRVARIGLWLLLVAYSGAFAYHLALRVVPGLTS